MSKEYLQKATEIRRAAEQRIAAIQGNKQLDGSDRVRQIMEIRAWANEQIETQKRLHARAREQARIRVLRRVFGLGFLDDTDEAEKLTERTSYRDAIFKADAAESPERAHLFLDRAAVIGDELLARAVAFVAYERGWHSVVSAYLDAYESAREPLSILQTVLQTTKREQQLLETVAFSQIAETDEEQASHSPEEDAAPKTEPS